MRSRLTSLVVVSLGFPDPKGTVQSELGICWPLSLPLFEVSHLCGFALLGSAQPECSANPLRLDLWKLLPHTSLPLQEFFILHS